MSNLRTLSEVIGEEEFDKQILPHVIALSTDKIWRVKLALIQFIPQLAGFLDKNLFKERLEPVVLTLMADTVFQIREDAASLLLSLKEDKAPFNQDWLEECLEQKAREFHGHEKFSIRIQTIFLILRVANNVSQRYLNEKLLPFAFKLAEDPVPNIRFNFAKMVDQIYSKMTASNQKKAEDTLKQMIENEKVDFDVKYFAEKALKGI